MSTVTNYEILDGRKLIRIKGCDTLTKLAKHVLCRTLRSEGIEPSKEGIIEYLEGWCEWSQDTSMPCDEPECMIDQAVSTLVYSNVHFIDIRTQSSISNEERDEVAKAMTEVLGKPFAVSQSL